MKRFFPTACLVAVISLLAGVIWPNLSNAAMPTFTSLGRLTVQSTPGLTTPGAMALDGAGNLYVADYRGGEVFKFDRYGQPRAVVTVSASARGLAVTPDGSRLYVARGTGVAVVDVANGADIPLGDLTTAVFGAIGDMKLDDDGNLYVADSGTFLAPRQQILVFSPAGQLVATFGGVGATPGKFVSIGDLAFNPAGQLVVADQASGNNANRIQVFTLDPLSLAPTGPPAVYLTTTAANFGAPGLIAPRGIAFDAQGRGYFLDYQFSQLRVVAPDMTYLGSYGVAGSAIGQLANVQDAIIETGADGNTRLFVSCDGGRIEIFGIDGGANPTAPVNRAPSVPTVQEPTAGGEVASATPTLQFAAANDPDGNPLTYQVTVYRGATVVSQVTTAATTVTVNAGLLAENAAYSWTVQAFDTQGAGSGPSPSAAFVVNAVSEPPSTPVPSAPLNGEALAGDGQLVWQPSTDPDPNDALLDYRVEVSADAAFAGPLLAAGTGGNGVALADFAAYAELVDGAAYFWRVAALDGDQLASAPSATGRFVYDTAQLKVTANVADARVYLGGNSAFPGSFLGTAPLELRDLAPGVFSMVVERAGFEPFTAQVTVTGTANAAVYAKLDPAMQPASFTSVSSSVKLTSGLVTGSAAAPFLVDFDNDGKLDLLVGSAAGAMTIFPAMQYDPRQKPYGVLTFGAGRSLGLPVLPGAVPFVADWDNDGRKDLLVGLADGTVKLFLNSGQEAAPAFAAGQDLTACGSVLSVAGKAAPAVVDLDADGRKDLVVGNATGQLVAFFNQGSDEAPQLAAATPLFQVAGAAVPTPVDWDADGNRDLLVTTGGTVTPWRNDLAASGAFVAGTSLAVTTGNAVFPLDFDGIRGKDLLVGQADGRLIFWTGRGTAFAPTFLPALHAKVDAVAELVTAASTALAPQVDKIRTQIAAGSYAAAGKTAAALALQLPAGPARDAVTELAALCKAK